MLLTRYERTIARRYLWPGKGEGIIAVVAGFSLLGVMLGVAALIIVMSVMNGFRAELFDKIVSLNGHAVVQGYGGRLEDWRGVVDAARRTPGVTSATPLIEQPLMASADGRVKGILLRGQRQAEIEGSAIYDYWRVFQSVELYCEAVFRELIQRLESGVQLAVQS